jgi:hypothetical protein
MQTYFSEIDPSWSSIWLPTRRGEDVEALHERANGVLDLLVTEIENRFGGKHKNILLVSHAATVIVLCRALLAHPDLPLRVGCCSISEFSRKSDAPGVLGAWEALALASGSHLKEGASRDWGLEDIQIANGKVSVCTSGSLSDTLTKQTRSYQIRVFPGHKEKKTIVGHRYIAAVCDSLQSHMSETFDKLDQVEESVESRSSMF